MDQMGRRPALIIPLIGIIIKTLVYIIQQLFSLPLELLFLGSIVETLCGGATTFLSASFAFYADTVPVENRGKRLSIADVSFGISFSLMSFAIGLMIESWGFFWPYLVILGGHTINLLYVCFCVPESKTKTTNKIPVSARYIWESFKVIFISAC